MIPKGEIRILSQDDLKQALPMAEAITVMKEAFTILSTGSVLMPERTHIDIPTHQGTALFMPSYADHFGKIGLKSVNIYPNNPRHGLPCIQGMVCLLDGKTGTPQALLNGTYLTALRTGAASGLATDLMARPEADRVALFGAGIQARSQLEAVCAVRSVQQVRVFDLVTEAAAVFAEDMSHKLDVEVLVAESPQDAVRSADIICTVTVSTVPVFDHSDLRPGVHINAVGSYQPHVQEIPTDTVLQSRLVVDQRSAALHETGDLIIPIQKGLMEPTHIQADIGEIVTGQIQGRTSESEITLFKSVGVAIQDLAAATRALETAEAKNLGTLVEL